MVREGMPARTSEPVGDVADDKAKTPRGCPTRSTKEHIPGRNGVRFRGQ